MTSRKESHVFCMVFKACGETVFNFMFVTVHIFKVANFILVFKCIVRDLFNLPLPSMYIIGWSMALK
jgi:hypothetical protein